MKRPKTKPFLALKNNFVPKTSPLAKGKVLGPRLAKVMKKLLCCIAYMQLIYLKEKKNSELSLAAHTRPIFDISSAENNRPQHEASRNELQSLRDLFPGVSC